MKELQKNALHMKKLVRWPRKTEYGKNADTQNKE
jgi:hypothetical protein